MSTKLAPRQFIDSVLGRIVLNNNNLTTKVIAAHKPGEDYLVEVKINGVEVDFREFESLCRQGYSEVVMKTAREIFNEHYQQALSSSYEALENINNSAKDLAASLDAQTRKAMGLPPPSED